MNVIKDIILKTGLDLIDCISNLDKKRLFNSYSVTEDIWIELIESIERYSKHNVSKGIVSISKSYSYEDIEIVDVDDVSKDKIKAYQRGSGEYGVEFPIDINDKRSTFTLLFDIWIDGDKLKKSEYRMIEVM